MERCYNKPNGYLQFEQTHAEQEQRASKNTEKTNSRNPQCCGDMDFWFAAANPTDSRPSKERDIYVCICNINQAVRVCTWTHHALSRKHDTMTYISICPFHVSFISSFRSPPSPFPLRRSKIHKKTKPWLTNPLCAAQCHDEIVCRYAVRVSVCVCKWRVQFKWVLYIVQFSTSSIYHISMWNLQQIKRMRKRQE